jgi:hypothetical protein
MKNKEKIYSYILVLLTVFILFLSVYFNYKQTGQIDTNKLEEAVQIISDEIKVINQSSTEIPELTENDEQTLEVQEVEDESFELQGDIAYEGDAKHWNLHTDDNPQLTYISQIDSRWRYYPYTSTGNSSQTIGSSGCGVASAAMIIDSIKGYVDIRTLADVFVENGYRSANNGTYWSAYRAVADEFDIDYAETSYLDRAIELLQSDYYIIASCGNGLFTTGGHYIVIYGIEGNTLKIYDPYLYSGKFETSTRRGKVTVSGNTVYCSVDNFRKYANYKQFFCYGYDANSVEKENKTTVSTVSTNDTVQTTNYQVKITASSLRIRQGASTSYKQIGSYLKNRVVTILAISQNWGKTDLGWICLDYTSRDIDTLNLTNNAGQTKKLTRAMTLYSNSNLTGKKYNYKANTTIRILKNISSSVDYVQVLATGRKAYINNSAYSNVTITGARGTVGATKKLKACNLYKNSNLSGTRYTYKANTTLTILKNINSNVDQVKVKATGRVAYVNVNNYK